MLNHIDIMGRLVGDPELKYTGSGLSFTNFVIAVERDYPSKNTGERETDFIRCVAWRQNAEFVAKYFNKGSMIIVSGRLQINKWTGDDGIARTTPEILVDKTYFGGSKRSESIEDKTTKPAKATQSFADLTNLDYRHHFFPDPDDDTLPF